MKQRYFAFGCSYTHHMWATYADLIGQNFNEFHNFGWGGSSNRQITNKMFEVNEFYNLNPDTDFVTIMTTGVNRFSWFKPRSWVHSGDLSKDTHDAYPEMTGFIEKMWNDEWAIYESYIAITSAKRFLEAKGIEHKILYGLPFDFYKKDFFNINKDILVLIDRMLDCCEFKESLDEFRAEQEHYRFMFNGNIHIDSHPTIDYSLAYIEKYLPEYYTEKTKDFAKYCKDTLIFDQDMQGEIWSKFSQQQGFRYARNWSDLLAGPKE